MKKYLAIFLMLAMAAGCLGGCSGAPGAGGPDSEPGQTMEPGTADLKESELESKGADIAEPGKTEPLDADPGEGTGGSSSSGSGAGSVGSGSGAGSVGAGSGSTGESGESGSSGGSSKPSSNASKPSSNTGSSSSKPSGTGSSSSKPTGGTGTNSGSSKPSNSGNGSTKPTEPKPTEPKPTEHTCIFSISKKVDPTCTEDGYIEYTCFAGDAGYREIIPATGHSWQVIHHDEVGHWLAHGTCTCGWTFSTTGSGDALGDLWMNHNLAYDIKDAVLYHSGYSCWDEWIVDVPGYDTGFCPVCGATFNTQP